MTYDLLVADAAYSSWSFRGWLLFRKFDIPVRVKWTKLYDPSFQSDLAHWAPAKSVPVVRTPRGGLWTDSLAIAEGLAEAHPDVSFWPERPHDRAFARSLTAEMHSGFTALREACPMNLREVWPAFNISDIVKADLARLELLWSTARTHKASAGDWLFGEYTIADAFFAPVAARIACYRLPVSAAAQAYVSAHLADPAFDEWRTIARAQDRKLDVYPHPPEPLPWPQFKSD